MDGALIEDAISRGSANFNNLAKRVLLSDRLIIQNLNKFSFIGIINVLNFQYLKIETINRINMMKLGENFQFSNQFMLKYKYRLNIELLCRTQTIDDYVLRDFISNNLNVCFDTISWRQNLSEDFIREYFMLLDKDDIVAFQKLSEKFMEDMWDHLNIELLSSHQRISFSFFRLHKYDLYMTDNIEEIIKNGHRVLTLKLTGVFNSDILSLIEAYL